MTLIINNPSVDTLQNQPTNQPTNLSIGQM